MRYFRETLESVFAQTLQPAEVIVNDDGSRDGTPEFAEQFAREHMSRFGSGPALRVFRRSGQRQAASRNYAAQHARGEWLAFLDHDDVWAENKLERQMAQIGSDPEAEVCYTARQDLVQDPKRRDVFRPGRLTPVPDAEKLRGALYVNTTFMPGSVLIRRSTYLAHGGFDPSYRYVEDWEFWLRLLHAGVRFTAVREPLLRMRMHSTNQSNQALGALGELKEIYRRLVLPHIPLYRRWVEHQKSQSGQEAVAAYVLRSTGDSGYLGMMASSIARFPFRDPLRYKVMAHMLLTQLGVLRPARPEPARVPGHSPGTLVAFREPATQAGARDTAA